MRIDDYIYVFLDQSQGWFGSKVVLDWPQIFNLRLDPFERAGSENAPPYLMQFFGHNFWRFVFAQKEVARLGETFVEFPPMQKPALFNIEDIKKSVQKAISNRFGQ